MFTSLTQARALYEFFNKCDQPQLYSGGTARAKDFNPSWSRPSDPDGLYTKYIAKNMPAQRRVFHLVYGRANTAGGSMGGGSDELNARVLDFAKDLRRIVKEFAASFADSPEESAYRELVECALAKALVEGCELAKRYEIPDPL
jgi:hypothetical protein